MYKLIQVDYYDSHENIRGEFERYVDALWYFFFIKGFENIDGTVFRINEKFLKN